MHVASEKVIIKKINQWISRKMSFYIYFFKVKTRKSGLNQKEKEKGKMSSWKPEKATWPRKEVSRLKIRKGGLGQWKSIGACKERESHHNQSFN